MKELIEIKYVYCHQCGTAKAPHEVKGEDSVFLLLTALRHARDTGHTMGFESVVHEQEEEDDE